VLPPRAAADGTRRRLLERAAELFAAKGYHGVSVREVATAAGVRVSSVYNHLASKEDLYAELSTVGHDEWFEALEGALLDAGSDPLDQIRALVGAHARYHATYPILALVMNNDLHVLGPETAQRIFATRRAAGALFTGAIAGGVATGRFAPVDPLLSTLSIMSIGAMVTVLFSPLQNEGNRPSAAAAEVARWKAMVPSYGIDDVVASTVEAALKILAPPEGG
jgi:AcrR family transcriptional regulator